MVCGAFRGAGEDGQLGLGTFDNKDHVCSINTLARLRVVSIVAGSRNSLAICENGQVRSPQVSFWHCLMPSLWSILLAKSTWNNKRRFPSRVSMGIIPLLQVRWKSYSYRGWQFVCNSLEDDDVLMQLYTWGWNQRSTLGHAPGTRTETIPSQVGN